MAKLIDLTGQRFGRLTVVSRAENNQNRDSRWNCQCDCGKQKVVLGKSLRKAETRSCGCYCKEIVGKLHRTHGEHNTRLYHIWERIKTKTLNKGNKDYKYYGARGITICDEWLNDFSAFKDWALQNGYADNLTIDRIDNDKGYCPQNCRWANMSIQANNKRSNRYVTLDGKTKTLSEWTHIFNLNENTLKYRLRRGWSVEKALTTPVKKKKSTLGDHL